MARSRAREGDKRREVMPIGQAQGVDIPLPNLGRALATVTSPSERGATQLVDQQVCHEARVTAVAIGKRVDLHEAMMKSHCDLVCRIRILVDPDSGVVT